MAYMDDQALERDQQRQRLLANAPQIGLGDPAQQPQGVQAPQAPPAPMLSIESILANLAGSLAPKGVNVTPGEALKTPFTLPNRPGVPTPEKWKSDNTLGAVLQGILGAKGSGIQQLQQRLLQAQQGQRPAPYQPQQLIPGLQPGVDASKAMPGTPAARAYMTQQDKTTGGVTGVEKPPQGPAESSTLADQRKQYAAQLDANPALKEKMAALMVAEEGGDATARTALAESALNRGVSRGIPSLDAVLDPNYYAPFKDGGYAKAIARLRSDPQFKAQVYADMDRAAKGGSNISNLATDNASGAVAANAKTNSTHTWTAGNGETFTRKDVRPDVHGKQNVELTQDWHAKTTAAQAAEKPATTQVAGPAQAAPTPAQPSEPPTWLTKEAMPLPPSGGFVDTVDKVQPPGPNATASNMSIQPGAAQPPAQPPAQPQESAAQPPPPQAPPPRPTPPAPPQAPQAAAPMPPPKTGVNAARAIVDRPFNTFLTKEDLAQIPSQYQGSTPREMAGGWTGSMFMSRAEPLFNKFGFTRQDAEKVLREPAPAPGKRSDIGTSDATDFSARSRTPPGEPGTPLPPSGFSPNTAGQQRQPGPGELPARLPGAITPVDVSKGQQVTPEMVKALENAVKDQERPPGLQPTPPGAQPVQLPSQVAPPLPGAPGGPTVPGPGGALMPGVAPQMMMEASQGNPIAMMGLSPIAPAPLSTPLTQQQPIPWTDPPSGGWGGWSGGGFDGGLTGGFSFGGGE